MSKYYQMVTVSTLSFSYSLFHYKHSALSTAKDIPLKYVWKLLCDVSSVHALYTIA